MPDPIQDAFNKADPTQPVNAPTPRSNLADCTDLLRQAKAKIDEQAEQLRKADGAVLARDGTIDTLTEALETLDAWRKRETKAKLRWKLVAFGEAALVCVLTLWVIFRG